MTTITRERLLKIQQWRETYGPGSNVVLPAEEAEELARIALASQEAEIAAYLVTEGRLYRDKVFLSLQAAEESVSSRNDGAEIKPLYAAPPVSVSVPDITALDNLAGEMLNNAMNCERRVAVAYTHCAHRLAEEVRDLRAAMLQGKAEPVSNRDELPVIGWLRSDYNSDDKRDPNAPLFMLGRNDPSETWGVKYIPLTGNSPVIPDGYVVVPVEPTMAMLDEFDSIIDYGAEDSKDAWCRLIAAAPQQGVK